MHFRTGQSVTASTMHERQNLLWLLEMGSQHGHAPERLWVSTWQTFPERPLIRGGGDFQVNWAVSASDLRHGGLHGSRHGCPHWAAAEYSSASSAIFGEIVVRIPWIDGNVCRTEEACSAQKRRLTNPIQIWGDAMTHGAAWAVAMPGIANTWQAAHKNEANRCIRQINLSCIRQINHLPRAH